MRLILVMLSLLLVANCSGVNPLKLLSGGGVNTAANVQAGKENSQNIGVNTTVRPVLRPEGPVDTVVQDNSTTKNTELDPLLIILLILGWLAPSPSEIGRSIAKLFRRRDK